MQFSLYFTFCNCKFPKPFMQYYAFVQSFFFLSPKKKVILLEFIINLFSDFAVVAALLVS